MSIYFRLREERKRLGMTQEAFGIAGGVLKGAVINYEKGDRAPDASFLGGIAAAGADVLYILTGKRESDVSGALTDDESQLLSRYRQGSAVLRGYLQEMSGTQEVTGNTVAIGGDVGQAIAGDASFSAPVNFGRAKK